MSKRSSSPVPGYEPPVKRTWRDTFTDAASAAASAAAEAWRRANPKEVVEVEYQPPQPDFSTFRTSDQHVLYLECDINSSIRRLAKREEVLAKQGGDNYFKTDKDSYMHFNIDNTRDFIDKNMPKMDVRHPFTIEHIESKFNPNGIIKIVNPNERDPTAEVAQWYVVRILKACNNAWYYLGADKFLNFSQLAEPNRVIGQVLKGTNSGSPQLSLTYGPEERLSMFNIGPYDKFNRWNTLVTNKHNVDEATSYHDNTGKWYKDDEPYSYRKWGGSKRQTARRVKKNTLYRNRKRRQQCRSKVRSTRRRSARRN
jgi:hypothetical protein